MADRCRVFPTSARAAETLIVVTSEGTHVVVGHPEPALLTKHRLQVMTAGGHTTEHLCLLHVAPIQRQEKAASSRTQFSLERRRTFYAFGSANSRFASLSKKSASLNGSWPMSCHRTRPSASIRKVPCSGCRSKSSQQR